MSKRVAALFKALSDETRIDIIRRLVANRNELSCKELLEKIPLAQPTLSHHFNKLIAANILTVRKVGVSHYYRVNRRQLMDLGLNIQKLVGQS